MSYRLVVREGKDAGRSFPLLGPTVTLGRPGSEVADAIEFEEPSVSRVHAVLQWREDEACFELSNRSLTSPAQVDGQPAVSGALLVHGSVIQLGSLLAEIRLEGVDPPPTPLMGYLEVVQGPDGTNSRFEIFRKKTVIGRSAGCEVCLPSYAIARQQAVLEWFDDLPLLMPVSTATILVNGQEIPRGAFLAPHDWIILGTNVSLRWLPAGVLDSAPQEETPPAPEPPALVEAPTPAPEPAPAPAEEEPAPAPPRVGRPTRVMEALPAAQAAPPRRAAPPAPPVVPPTPPRRKAAERWRTVTLRARAGFFADLMFRLQAREPIQRAVQEVAEARLPRLAPTLTREILGGRSLSEALGRFPECFTPYELGMIAAGEEAGTLESQLMVLATSMKGAVALRGRLLGWMLPAFLAVGLGLPMLMLRPLVQDQGPAAFFGGLLLSMLGTALLVSLLMALRYVLARFAGYRRLEEDLMERLPVIGPMLRLRAGGRFLRSLGPLLNAGLQVQRAALLAAGCTGSTKHALSLVKAARQIERGSPVLDSLAPTGLLSADVLSEVGKGEERGDLPERLAAAAERLHVAASRATETAIPVVAATLSALLLAAMLISVEVARVLMEP